MTNREYLNSLSTEDSVSIIERIQKNSTSSHYGLIQWLNDEYDPYSNTPNDTTIPLWKNDYYKSKPKLIFEGRGRGRINLKS